MGECVAFLRRLAGEVTAERGTPQVATVGRVALAPNLVNVVPATATFTVDLRNSNDVALKESERRFASFLVDTAAAQGCSATTSELARFEPVDFDKRLVELVSATAVDLGHSVKRLPSGAGHDAQMMARICPTAMIFTPSQHGLSHNPAEHTEPEDLEAGANVLLHVMASLAEETA